MTNEFNTESITSLLIEAGMIFERATINPAVYSGDPIRNLGLAALAFQQFEVVAATDMEFSLGEATAVELETALTNGRKLLSLIHTNLGEAAKIDPLAANFASKLAHVEADPSDED